MGETAEEASLCGQHASCDGYTSGTDNKHDQRVKLLLQEECYMDVTSSCYYLKMM